MRCPPWCSVNCFRGRESLWHGRAGTFVWETQKISQPQGQKQRQIAPHALGEHEHHDCMPTAARGPASPVSHSAWERAQDISIAACTPTLACKLASTWTQHRQHTRVQIKYTCRQADKQLQGNAASGCKADARRSQRRVNYDPGGSRAQNHDAKGIEGHETSQGAGQG